MVNSKHLFGSVGNELPPASQAVETAFAVLDRLPTLKESGRLLVQEALNRAQGNQTIAAQMLGVPARP